MRGRFRITDPAALDVLRALGHALEEEGLRYAIAGGMGVQALLAAAGLEHLLRSTGDIDVLVKGEDEHIVRALNRLAADRKDLRVTQNPAAKNARVGPLNVDWINEPGRLRGLEDAWEGSIEQARVVTVRGLRVPVQQPEVLVAAKLTGQKVREQDALDVSGVLLSGTALDEACLRGLLATRPARLEAFLAIRDRLPQDGS